MKFARGEKERLLQQRIMMIVDLSCRRDRILEAHHLDLDALAVLAADYEAANMPCAAIDLQRRIEYYREKEVLSKAS
jgi:hypothetical protein